MNSKLSVQKIEKHEIQILDCDGELKDNHHHQFNTHECSMNNKIHENWRTG